MKPRVIGLTGGIASGKSEAASILKELGAFVVDADKIAREVVLLPEIHEQLKKEWPLAFEHETLERKKLAQIIFASKDEREKLNRILHPIIIQRALEEIRNSPKHVCVLVAPLLVEAGLHHVVDEVWAIHAPKETQIERLVKRDGISKEEALRMIESQLPSEEKSAFAHRVFNNSESTEALQTQLKKEWDDLKER